MNTILIGWVSIVSSSLIEAVGHLAFKRAVDDASSAGPLAGFQAILRSPRWIGFGALCFVAEGLLFSVSLRLLDVSIAFPAGALTFVGVALFSRLWLHEVVGLRRWLGILLILTGIVLVGAN